jgi:hypothetical protein
MCQVPGFVRHKRNFESTQIQSIIWTPLTSSRSKSPTHIGHKLKDIGQTLKDCNRKYILQILSIIVMLAIGGEAFRGHHKSDDSSNQGNFLNTLDLLWKSDAEFDEKFKALPDNAKYIGPQIQNK